MINLYSRMFLIDAVSKFRNTEREMWDVYCARTRHAHDDASDYLCAAVEVFLKNDDEDFRDILNRETWNIPPERRGYTVLTDEHLVKRLKRRARRIVRKHRPEFVSPEELSKRLKPVVKKWRSMTEDEIKSFHEFIAQIEADRKK